MTTSRNSLLALTIETVPGRDITEVLGIVKGSTVRAKHVGADIAASLRNLVGGEVREYAQLLAGAREQAMDRMIEDARTLGADAIVGVRMQTSAIQNGASEVVFYGTAVKLSA
ncbi:YbjQ family protein [Falsihalocynthiibacter sp. SS001]|uniref:YbjQ family protein n=1 Tax=Falsihalocynthiibacter sp. SS001 TaxID=3349698 RepID=UPI0036D36838